MPVTQTDISRTNAERDARVFLSLLFKRIFPFNIKEIKIGYSLLAV